MAIDAISSAGASSVRQSSIGLQDFLKILLTQLTYQDPLKPLDNQEFMAQMAQFTTLEQTQQMNDKLGQLVNSQSSLQSVGLLGRTVDAETDGGPLSGRVTAMTLQDGVPQLTLTMANGASASGIALTQLVRVR